MSCMREFQISHIIAVDWIKGSHRPWDPQLTSPARVWYHSSYVICTSYMQEFQRAHEGKLHKKWTRSTPWARSAFGRLPKGGTIHLASFVNFLMCSVEFLLIVSMTCRLHKEWYRFKNILNRWDLFKKKPFSSRLRFMAFEKCEVVSIW